MFSLLKECSVRTALDDEMHAQGLDLPIGWIAKNDSYRHRLHLYALFTRDHPSRAGARKECGTHDATGRRELYDQCDVKLERGCSCVHGGRPSVNDSGEDPGGLAIAQRSRLR